MKTQYEWKRYWCSREGTIRLTSEGFLEDPHAYMKLGHVVSFEEISQKECLALLGEPGVGKTNSLKQFVEAMKDVNKPIYLDLRSYSSDERLIKDLFESPLFLDWKRSNSGDIYIFLDSLDECLLRMDHISFLLSQEFEKYDVTRIKLRIACRTANWPRALEEELIKLWGKNSYEAFELAPLQKKDVYEAALTNGINASQFIEDIIKKGVVSFAIKPVTLQFLINTYTRYRGSLPLTQKDIFLEGCSILCEELNSKHKKHGKLSVRERLSISTRIAALTIFTNKFAVWADVDLGNVPEEDITLGEIAYGLNRGLDLKLVLKEEDILEVINTGLFTSRGLHRFGWAHQTYAEFLAALYTVENNLSFQQILNLIEHPDDPQKKIVPQLHGVSSWIALFNSDIFKHIRECDPEVLLRIDLTSVDDRDKESLVDNILEGLGSGRIYSINNEFSNYFYNIKHSNLSEQLRPYITDTNKGSIVRRVAINIARASEQIDLVEDLLKTSLNKENEYNIRIRAIHAFYHLSNAEQKLMLIPLTQLDVSEDPNEELKGIALSSLWPDLISSKELFPLLTLPKRKNYIGNYRMFLRHVIVDNLNDTDLIYALKWIVPYIRNNTVKSVVEPLFHHVMNKSLDYLNDINILKIYIRILQIRIRRFDHFHYLERIKYDNKIRRYLIKELVGSSELNNELIGMLAFSRFIADEDFPWLVDQITSETDVLLQSKWVEIIIRHFRINNSSHVQLIHNAMQENSILDEKFSRLFNGISLDSKEAGLAKKEYYRNLRNEKKLEERKRKTSPTSLPERIEKRVNEIHSGNLDAWHLLCLEVGVDTEGIIQEFQPNLTKYSSWQIINEEIRENVVVGAKIYLLGAHSNSKEWLSANTIYASSLTAYKALRLLYDYDYHFLKEMPNERWHNWSPVILSQWTSSEEDIVRSNLISMAYERVPSSIISDLLVILCKEKAENSDLYILRILEKCWDERLGQTLFDWLKSNDLQLRTKQSLTEYLLHHSVTGVKEHVISMIDKYIFSPNKMDRVNALISLAALCTHYEGGLKIAWRFIEDNENLFKELMLMVAGNGGFKIKTNRLDEKFLADLYIKLGTHFPHKEDPKFDDEEMGHYVTPREDVAEFRDDILDMLINFGTDQSRTEMLRILNVFPEIASLKWNAAKAQEVARQKLWVPPRALDIILLTGNDEGRLIYNGEQLLEVIRTSLEKIERKLHGNTPEVFLLWNDLGDKKFKPRTENEFSDYVKQRLEDDLTGRGIILNREVEIRRSFGSYPGERTDIQVDAVLKNERGNYDNITVVIEVKGNWNNNVSQALETQLVNRYLKEEKNKYGIYLVGWFESELWDKEDPRYKKANTIKKHELEVILSEQARKCSTHSLKAMHYIMNLEY
ncbi:NACHT domain-containing protein [Paenibacillus chitinolyticus]